VQIVLLSLIVPRPHGSRENTDLQIFLRFYQLLMLLY
jgi:hypothetical protein